MLDIFICVCCMYRCVETWVYLYSITSEHTEHCSVKKHNLGCPTQAVLCVTVCYVKKQSAIQGCGGLKFMLTNFIGSGCQITGIEVTFTSPVPRDVKQFYSLFICMFHKQKEMLPQKYYSSLEINHGNTMGFWKCQRVQMSERSKFFFQGRKKCFSGMTRQTLFFFL